VPTGMKSETSVVNCKAIAGGLGHHSNPAFTM
jgi:hypothetical protein